MNKPTLIFVSYLLAVNIITFFVYGIDKLKAKKSLWRVPESTLLLLAVAGGSIGAWSGIKVWHHKTKHKKFKYGVPAIIALQVSLSVAGIYFCMTHKADHTLSEIRQNQLQQQIDSLLADVPAEIGVAVTCEGRKICGFNENKRFPMMSVYKLHQAVAVLDSLNRSTQSADDRITVTKQMLKENTYSPLRERYPEGNIRMSLRELLRYSLEQSDNNACDILFSLFGGTAYTNTAMMRMGLTDTQIKWTEDEMHKNSMRCKDNYTTPQEAVALTTLAYKDTWLRQVLTQCQTGKERIPALLPKSRTTVGHKTGTGVPAPDGTTMGINDTGFVTLPDGTPYFIAVFCNESSLSIPETEKIIARISRLSYDYLIKKYGTRN